MSADLGAGLGGGLGAGLGGGLGAGLDADLRVGLDIGATKVLGVVVATDGTVVTQSRELTVPGADGVLAAATAVLDRLAAALDGALPPRIGIGIPGSSTVTAAPYVMRSTSIWTGSGSRSPTCWPNAPAPPSGSRTTST